MGKLLNTTSVFEIEELIDSNSLASVLYAISEICHGKADHLRTNWQDNNQAADWERFGKSLEYASIRAEKALV